MGEEKNQGQQKRQELDASRDIEILEEKDKS